MNDKIVVQMKVIFKKKNLQIFYCSIEKIKKPGKKFSGLCYIDGLVSTGNKFPYTILKINFALRKNICNFFINILNLRVDNHQNKTLKIEKTITRFLNFDPI